MNIWENAVITSKGLALQSKLTQGTSLTITRAVAGAGYVSPALLQQQTAVLNPKQTLKFSSASYPEEGKCAVPVSLTNEGLGTGYTVKQIGFYATDPDQGEILYFICQAASNNGTDIPSEAEMPGYNAEWTFYFKYGQASNVTVTVDPANTINAAQAQHMVDEGTKAAKSYTDQKIAAIPTPDVSGQIGVHNTSSAAHADIRALASAAESNAKKYTDQKIATIPTPDVSGQIGTHNNSDSAHADIRAAVNGKAPMYTYGTEDLVAGETPLESGKLHFVYV